MEEILKVSGAEILPYKPRSPYPMGSVTHEAGGARMGEDRKKSVLDTWNRCHDIKNLLVVDAACFVSHPEKSVTLTIMALAMRASEHLAEEMRVGSRLARLFLRSPLLPSDSSTDYPNFSAAAGR